MIELSERQKKWAAAGITSVAVTLVFAFVVGICWMLLKLVDLAAPALVPVVLGVLLAMFFKPYFGWFLKRLKNPTLAFVAMSLTVLVPAGVVFWLVGSMIVEQISAFAAAAPTIVARASEWCQITHPGLYDGLVKFGVPDDMLHFFTRPAQFSQDLISSFGAEYGVKAIKASFSLVKYFTWIVGGLITTIFFVYFLMKPEVHGKDCVKQMPFLKENTRNFVAAQIDSFFEIIVSFLQRQVVICLIEGALYGIGFKLVGLPYGFVIGFLLGVVNLVPLLGTVICLPVALLLAFFGDGGSTLRLVGVTCVWACGQFADGYAITPLIQGNRTGLGFAGVIFSFVFWSAVFQSFLGLLLAIPLSAFCLVLWRTVKERYIKEVI
jgi:predicted PurR-regulated permease PerM